jgi:hypothetical protein
MDAKSIAIQRATFGNVPIDRTKTCNEQNFCACARHVGDYLPLGITDH